MHEIPPNILDPLFSLCRYDGQSNPRLSFADPSVCGFVFYTSKNSAFSIDSLSLLGKLPEVLTAKDGSALLRLPALILTIDWKNFYNYLNTVGMQEDFPPFKAMEQLRILTSEQSSAFGHLFSKLYAWHQDNPESLRLLKYSWLYEVLLAIRHLYQDHEPEDCAKPEVPAAPERTVETTCCMPKAAPACGAARDTVNSIIPYIREHYMEPLSVDAISELFYISKYHLMREFKRYTGSTIHTYIRNERIAHAQTMISHGMNAGEVSHIVGFSDYSLFYRAFVKVTGMTPTEYGNRMMQRTALQ